MEVINSPDGESFSPNGAKAKREQLAQQIVAAKKALQAAQEAQVSEEVLGHLQQQLEQKTIQHEGCQALKDTIFQAKRHLESLRTSWENRLAIAEQQKNAAKGALCKAVRYAESASEIKAALDLQQVLVTQLTIERAARATTEQAFRKDSTIAMQQGMTELATLNTCLQAAKEPAVQQRILQDIATKTQIHDRDIRCWPEVRRGGCQTSLPAQGPCLEAQETSLRPYFGRPCTGNQS